MFMHNILKKKKHNYFTELSKVKGFCVAHRDILHKTIILMFPMQRLKKFTKLKSD